MSNLVLSRRSFLSGTGASLILPPSAHASWFGWTKSIDNAPVYSNNSMEQAMNNLVKYLSDEAMANAECKRNYKNYNAGNLSAVSWKKWKEINFTAHQPIDLSALGGNLSQFSEVNWERDKKGQWKIVDSAPGNGKVYQAVYTDDLTIMKAKGLISRG